MKRPLLWTGLIALIALAPARAADIAVSSAGAGPPVWSNDLTPIGPGDWNYARAAHLLARAGFGGTPEEVAKLAAMTPQAAVDYLVDFEKIDASALPAFEESDIYPNGYKFDSIQNAAKTAFTTGQAFGTAAKQEGALPYQPGINEFYTLLWSDYGEIARAGQWWAERMVISPRPFQERMALFWHDHFATSQDKVHRHRMMLNQIELLRQNAAGNFGELLVKISQDPAMLIWLDNKDNVKGHPNENFAREIMELFTMGEGHGYGESDIREMARAFTGWTLTEDVTTAPGQGEFIDKPELHDDGVKTFLGETGKFNGYDAIAIILKQEAPARFITGKIYKDFVRQDLSADTHEALARQFRESGYELKPLMKTIFLSRDFYSAATVGAQIKAPVQLIVSTYRKLGLRAVPGMPDFNELCADLGQTLLMPPNVAGWAGDKTWVNPATLLARGNFVNELLFPPDPMDIEPPDKDIHEGYRKIPVMFPEYNITPYIWSNKTGKMEAVSLAVYDQYLAGLPINDAMQMMSTGAGMSNEEMKTKLASNKVETKSQMGKLADGEQYNLAVGVYTGAARANDRVKAIPRTPAQVDLGKMLQGAGVTTGDQAVDYLIRRFLSVELGSQRKAAIEDYVKTEIGDGALDYADAKTDPALRRILYLILSAPEYQLD